jgi:hypothetical protein
MATREEAELSSRDEPWEVFELRAPVAVIRDRLEIIGADWDQVRVACEESIAERIHFLKDFQEDRPTARAEHEIDVLQELTLGG